MYTVETDIDSQQQIDALPADALAAYAELRVMLETAPWNGQRLRRDNPSGPVRTQAFGAAGMATYLVLDRQRRVDMLLVQWAG